MNELDYGSREACQRLVDAGIILETEFYWFYWNEKWHGHDAGTYKVQKKIPRPSMAEVWRELKTDTIFHFSITNGVTDIWPLLPEGDYRPLFKNTNPTDSLIDLKIWLSEVGGKRYGIPSKTATEIDLEDAYEALEDD